MSSAGDITKDGYDDLIIGAYEADPNDASSPVSPMSCLARQQLLSISGTVALDGTNGFVINGIDASDFSGYSVSSAGDINNDGYDDIIIGASTQTLMRRHPVSPMSCLVSLSLMRSSTSLT